METTTALSLISTVPSIAKIATALRGPRMTRLLSHEKTEQGPGSDGGHNYVVTIHSKDRQFTVDAVHLTNLGEDPERNRVRLLTVDGEQSVRLDSYDSARFITEELHLGGEGAQTPHRCWRGPLLLEVGVAGRTTAEKFQA